MFDTPPPPLVPRPSPPDERGVALLLTLGILSLLLVLAMSFAFSARTELMAAGVNADVTKAKLLAESGLERAMAYLKYSHYAGHPQDIYPATKQVNPRLPFIPVGGRLLSRSTDSAADVSGNDRLVTKYSNGTATVEFLSASDIAGSRWMHISDSSGLIGRIAYVVIDESGKIDPSAVVDGTNTEDSGSTVRQGYSVTEICLQDTLPSGWNLYRPTPEGKMPDGKRWLGWGHIIKGLPANQTHLDAATDVLFPFSYDIEAWNDSGTAKHRYDLSDAASATVADLLEPASDFYSGTTIGLSEGGIDWLLNMVAQDGTTSVSNQVAANIIDYCDGGVDDLPTTDYPTVDPPTYVGLEKVPYINEIVLTADVNDVGGNKFNQIVVKVDVELINMYGGTMMTSGMVLEVRVDYVDNLGFGMTEDNWTFTVPADQSFSTYTPYDPALPVYRLTKNYNSATDETQTNFGINGIEVLLKNSSGKLLDYADIGRPATNTGLFHPGNIKKRCWGNAQIGDARANGSPLNWEWRGNQFYMTDKTTTPTHTLSSLNNCTKADPYPSTAYLGYSIDAEGSNPATVNDPATDLHNAFIRNGPMESLWELGAIHRGEAWRTINLKAYGTDGTYAGGDAAILDQVKLGPATEARGKVNANSPVPEVWSALLGGIRVRSNGYNDPGNGGSLIDSVIGDKTTGLVKEILDRNGTQNSSSPNSSRGAFLALVNDFWDGGTAGSVNISQPDDRSQEEIIGKLANLLTVRQNYFTIIVVGQAVKDLGAIASPPSPLPTNWISYAAGKYCTKLAEQKIMAVVYRDAYANTYRIERYEYLDD